MIGELASENQFVENCVHSIFGVCFEIFSHSIFVLCSVFVNFAFVFVDVEQVLREIQRVSTPLMIKWRKFGKFRSV